MTAPLLKIEGLCQRFGGLTALDQVSLSIKEGEIMGLIGPNGAGKTTFFNLLTGVYPGNAGTIQFNGREIRGLKPHQIIARGVARTFQNIRLFSNMTALENVMAARYCRTKTGLFSALVRLPSFHREEREVREAARERLQFVGLLSSGNNLAKNLSYGDQRRLEIARALATEPKLLILDEPTAGMNFKEGESLVALIQSIREQGIAVLLIEHHMKVVMGISDSVAVLNYGRKIAEGTPEQIQRDPHVIEAYLGKEAS